METSPVRKSRKPEESPLVEEVKLLRLEQIEHKLRTCAESAPTAGERRKQVQPITPEARQLKRQLTDNEPKLFLPAPEKCADDTQAFRMVEGDGLQRRERPLKPEPRKHYERILMDGDAENRLSRILGRKPTAKEISQLRRGEQALRLDNALSAQARQLVGQTRALRRKKNELLAKLLQTRKKSHRLRKLAARQNGSQAAKSD